MASRPAVVFQAAAEVTPDWVLILSASPPFTSSIITIRAAGHNPWPIDSMGHRVIGTLRSMVMFDGPLPTIPEGNRVLVVMAHPDDAEFGCGGTIAKWAAAGKEINYVL